jgi:hypothetical protein
MIITEITEDTESTERKEERTGHRFTRIDTDESGFQI